MAVFVTLEIEFKPGMAGQALEGFKTDLKDTRNFKGCLGLELLQDKEDLDHIILYEKWNSKEDQMKYWKWRTDSGSLDQMGAVLASPPVIKYFDSKGTF